MLRKTCELPSIFRRVYPYVVVDLKYKCGEYATPEGQCSVVSPASF
jgi:hypothetical protein